jgi:nuclear GTP-binding protein
MLSDF